MLLSLIGQQKTEDVIVESLHRNPLVGPTLLENVRQKDKSLPKETFYRILRELLKQEVVNKSKNTYQLNRHWIQKLYTFSKLTLEKKEATDRDNILSFQDGDKIKYSFKNPNLMGIYWAHTYDMIFDNHDPKVPILIFHPHEWLIHTRFTSESFFLSRPKSEKKLVWFAIGGKTPLDKDFQKNWSNKYIQTGVGINPGFKNTEYVNILGDFIFKISMSKKFSEDLEKFFTKYSIVDENNTGELNNICTKKDSVKMTFTRSKKESDKYRAKFKKYFYIPK